eukprot:534347-Pelagomonas_calceolata.AAC.4
MDLPHSQPPSHKQQASWMRGQPLPRHNPRDLWEDVPGVQMRPGVAGQGVQAARAGRAGQEVGAGAGRA